MPPLRIEAQGLHKRFGRHWIVYNFSHVFEPGSHTAIVGPNGSGKSTLVKLLSGQLLPSEGKVGFGESRIKNSQEVPVKQPSNISADEIYRHISLTAPYLELIEELSGEELLRLHYRMRGFRQNLSLEVAWERLKWPKRVRRQMVSSYSSGMKQRIRLILALATEAGVVFLDEPSSNLDLEGVNWYQHLLKDWTGNRTLIIASNEERDFSPESLRIEAKEWRVG